MALEAEEHPEQSIHKFESMLKTNSVYFFDTEDFEEITHHYLNSGKIALSKKAIQIGLEQHPNSVALKLLQVEILALEEKYDAAEILLDELQNLDIHNEEIYIQRANIKSRKDNHKEAIKLLIKALQLTEGDSDIHSLLGMEYLFVEDYEKAKQSFIKCVALDASDYSALYNVIYCFDFLKDREGAIHYLNNYLEKNPYCDIAWHQLGKIHHAAKQYKKALDAFDFAIISDDAFTGAYFDKARVLEVIGRHDEAIKNYEITLTLEDPTAYAYLRIGKCYEKSGKHRLAKRYYYDAVHEDPLLDKGWLAITDFYYKLGEYPEALYHINKALSIDEENALYWKKAATINATLSHWKAADLAYQKAIHLGSHDNDLWLQWAEVLEKINESDTAICVLQQGLELYPDDIEIIFRLAQLYLKNKNNACAKTQIIKIIEIISKKVQHLGNNLDGINTVASLQKLVEDLKET